jgi:hypothetical protein
MSGPCPVLAVANGYISESRKNLMDLERLTVSIGFYSGSEMKVLVVDEIEWNENAT